MGGEIDELEGAGGEFERLGVVQFDAEMLEVERLELHDAFGGGNGQVHDGPPTWHARR